MKWDETPPQKDRRIIPLPKQDQAANTSDNRLSSIAGGGAIFLAKGIRTPVAPMKIGMPLAEKKGPKLFRASWIYLASPRGFEPLLPA